jgi:ribosomal-protein-alanine N-acetyltransferase
MTNQLIPPDALGDDVLTLRPFRLEDTEAIADAGNDPEVAHWTPFPSPYTVGHVREWIASQPATDAVDLVITDAIDGTVLGWVGLHDLAPYSAGRNSASGWVRQPAATATPSAQCA